MDAPNTLPRVPLMALAGLALATILMAGTTRLTKLARSTSALLKSPP